MIAAARTWTRRTRTSTRRAAAIAIATMILGAAGVAVAATWAGAAMFLGASEGMAVPFEPVALPPVALSGGDFGDDGGGHVPRFAEKHPFAPSLETLLEGEIVITSHDQMRWVWSRLFETPYEAGQFDFETTFVVFMGGGLLLGESFDIHAVETFEATFAGPFPEFPETFVEPGLAVISQTFVPGVPPDPDKEPVYRVAAARIDLAYLRQIVYHRSFFYAP